MPGGVGSRRAVAPNRALPLCERLPLVLSLEALDAARGVHELLLAGEEGVTLGAYLHPDVGPSGAGVNDFSAVAGDRRVHVIGMNASLHGPPPRWRSNRTRKTGKTQENRAVGG